MDSAPKIASPPMRPPKSSSAPSLGAPSTYLRTRASCSDETIGPMSVSMEAGSPSRMLPAIAADALDDVVEDGLLDQDPRPGHAGLAGTAREHGGRAHPGGGGVEVGVGKDEIRRLAAELHVQRTNAVGTSAPG